MSSAKLGGFSPEVGADALACVGSCLASDVFFFVKMDTTLGPWDS